MLHSAMHNATGHLADYSESQTKDIWCYLGGWAPIQQEREVLSVNYALATVTLFCYTLGFFFFEDAVPVSASEKL